MKLLTLSEARTRAKLTQDELAMRSGVHQTTISRLETGDDPNPTQRTIARLAKALGIAPSCLQFSEPEPTPKVARGNDRRGQKSREAVA